MASWNSPNEKRRTLVSQQISHDNSAETMLTLLTGENQDHSQRPNLPRTSTEGWRLAPVLIVKCQNCTAHADSGHLLHTSISQWRSVWGTALVFSPVIWVTELVLSSAPLQSMNSFCTVKLGAISVHFLSSSVHGDILLRTRSVCIKQTNKKPQYFEYALRMEILYTFKLLFGALFCVKLQICVEWKVPNINSLPYIFYNCAGIFLTFVIIILIFLIQDSHISLCLRVLNVIMKKNHLKIWFLLCNFYNSTLPVKILIALIFFFKKYQTKTKRIKNNKFPFII